MQEGSSTDSPRQNKGHGKQIIYENKVPTFLKKILDQKEQENRLEKPDTDRPEISDEEPQLVGDSELVLQYIKQKKTQQECDREIETQQKQERRENEHKRLSAKVLASSKFVTSQEDVHVFSEKDCLRDQNTKSHRFTSKRPRVGNSSDDKVSMLTMKRQKLQDQIINNDGDDELFSSGRGKRLSESRTSAGVSKNISRGTSASSRSNPKKPSPSKLPTTKPRLSFAQMDSEEEE
eukprot:TRINITY_DN30605_c0_g2_i1.p1 TRINITY_DN30605_c0_g2~~TRINITY_DN30605_c0_g2_i1.p1  ORF type:complete len:235 (+),score=58.66 TRINITY_DN30605_c0_g2_i1:71-775(+)